MRMTATATSVLASSTAQQEQIFKVVRLGAGNPTSTPNMFGELYFGLCLPSSRGLHAN